MHSPSDLQAFQTIGKFDQCTYTGHCHVLLSLWTRPNIKPPQQNGWELENVSIAKALQLEAARRRAVNIRLNFIALAKFEVAQPIRCSLRAFLLLICYAMLWPWTLTPWPWSLTLNICSRPALPRSNCVRNLSEIGQSAVELLQFEYLLTLWPWTCITCYAML